MSTPQQVVQRFLRDKAVAFAEANTRLCVIHGEYFGTPLLEQASAFLLMDPSKATFEEVEEGANSASVVTRQTGVSGLSLRERYHLHLQAGTWKISRLERECFICAGRGSVGQTRCTKCGGTGWRQRPFELENLSTSS